MPTTTKLVCTTALEKLASTSPFALDCKKKDFTRFARLAKLLAYQPMIDPISINSKQLKAVKLVCKIIKVDVGKKNEIKQITSKVNTA